MGDSVRVLLTKPYFPEDIVHLRAHLLENVSIVSPQAFTDAAMADAVKDDIHVLFGPYVSEAVLNNGRSLRLIQVPWAGVDVVDFELLRRYNIPVCNSHSNADVVAEYTVALMLAIAKKIPFHDQRLRQGKWCRPKRGDGVFMPPVMISGKTIGFVGYGEIAQAIAKMLSGFSVKLIAAARRDRADTPPPLAFLGGSDDMEFVVSESDFLFITLPLTDATRGLFNEHLLASMKPSAYLINISRGEVVDEDALYAVLKEKRIAGAAIDTWYNYPKLDSPDVLPSTKNQFHMLDNLVLSPHRAGFAEGRLPHLDGAIENINCLATGRPLINIVDVEVGY
ncbi:MAG: 2-hydroxyacid dehydrogenase [Candidatus Aquicultor sp.]